MSRLKKIVCALGLLAPAGGLFVTPAAAADEPKPKPAGGAKPAPPEGAKVIVLQLDASKLPPDVLKKLLELGAAKAKPAAKPQPDKKPGTKPAPGKPSGEKKPAAGDKPGAKPAKAISLADAVAIAEKTGKGVATKAERETEEGAVEFEVELTDAKGNKWEVVIDARGKVLEIEAEKDDDKKPGKKDDEKPGKKSDDGRNKRK